MSVKSSGTREPRRRFARTGRQLFQHRLTGVRELRERVRPVWAASFLHRKAGAHELRQRVRPFRAGSFPLNLSGGFAACGRRERCGACRAGAKRKDNLRFSFLFELLPFPWRVWRRLPICDRFETGERQSGYRSVSFSAFSQFTDSVLLHIRLNLRRRDIPVSRDPLARCYRQHLRG